MRSCSFYGQQGAFFRGGPSFPRSGRRAFTLLEMCVVLVILGVLMTVVAPGIQSAISEQAVRSDARELSMMVKTAMLQSSEEHRTYVLDLSPTQLALAPVPDPSAKKAASDDTTAAPDLPPDETWALGANNQLLVPAKREGDWRPLRSAQWVFRPGELCPATSVCFARGPARLQISFNPLTGNVENELSYFP